MVPAPCVSTVVACMAGTGCVTDITPAAAGTTHFLSEPADPQCVVTAEWTVGPQPAF